VRNVAFAQRWPLAHKGREQMRLLKPGRLCVLVHDLQREPLGRALLSTGDSTNAVLSHWAVALCNGSPETDAGGCLLPVLLAFVVLSWALSWLNKECPTQLLGIQPLDFQPPTLGDDGEVVDWVQRVL
jgi:hypothetical protein